MRYIFQGLSRSSLIIFFLCTPMAWAEIRSCAANDARPTVALSYADQTDRIFNLMEQQHVRVDKIVINSMLREIDKNLRKFFPGGPFDRNDFIAIAWVESSFNQMEDGTHGERGLFQIMPEEFRDYGVTEYFYGVKTNTRMAFRVLNGKYKRWHDYKRAIIAYNGVVRKNDGSWDEKYWRAFSWRKVMIDDIIEVQ